MGDVIDIRMFGDLKLQRAFGDLEKAMQRKLVRQSLRAGKKLQKPEAKKLVPVDRGVLRKSIKIRAGKKRKGKIGIVLRAGGPGARHVNLVELGTKKMPARSFIVQSAKNKTNDIIKEVGKQLKQKIESFFRSKVK
jgi:HK97 gp10 family phage protein